LSAWLVHGVDRGGVFAGAACAGGTTNNAETRMATSTDAAARIGLSVCMDLSVGGWKRMADVVAIARCRERHFSPLKLQARNHGGARAPDGGVVAGTSA
jgi:hypothetical protein